VRGACASLWWVWSKLDISRRSVLRACSVPSLMRALICDSDARSSILTLTLWYDVAFRLQSIIWRGRSHAHEAYIFLSNHIT
jgi:hypothetical protein